MWLCTLIASISIYFLTIVYLSEYINAATIDWEFMRKVGIIVLGSAGVLITIEKVSAFIWEDFTEKVKRNAENFSYDSPDATPDAGPKENMNLEMMYHNKDISRFEDVNLLSD